MWGRNRAGPFSLAMCGKRACASEFLVEYVCWSLRQRAAVALMLVLEKLGIVLLFDTLTILVLVFAAWIGNSKGAADQVSSLKITPTSWTNRSAMNSTTKVPNPLRAIESRH